MAISLFLSWILAITITPLLCVWFLKVPGHKQQDDPYDKPIYRTYKRFLHFCVLHRKSTFAVLVATLIAALYGFGFIPKFFFSDSSRNQFYVDYWRSESTHIDKTTQDITKIEAYIRSLKGVKSVTSFVGEGALRFVLTYNYHIPNTSYGQLLVTVDNYKDIDALMRKIESYLSRNFPDSEPALSKFAEGPSIEYSVEARFRGPDTRELHKLAEKAKNILKKEPLAKTIRDDWRQPVKNYRLCYSEAKARRTGVTRSDLSNAMQWNFSGRKVGIYREGNDLINIISRPTKNERKSIENLEKTQVWSSAFNCFLPLHQVIDKVDMTWDSPLIKRRNRERTITVQCNHRSGTAESLRQKVKNRIEAIKLSPGYSLEWGGEYHESQKGQAGLKKLFPLALLLMFITVACLFKTMREPIIIFLCLPFAVSGITAGLLLFNLPFGFMAILGFLGLSGMLIKNAIVLLDQINIELAAGTATYKAVLNSAVSRLRPVTMAAGTTILGMIPLITHPFFSAMAATIMSGLLVATVLTLIIVPVLYVTLFKVKPQITN
jgi:multidrug efflux pump subunit AcrB